MSNHVFVRALRVLKDDRPYELRDLNGRPISAAEAPAYIKAHLTVPEEIRRQRRKEKLCATFAALRLCVEVFTFLQRLH